MIAQPIISLAVDVEEIVNVLGLLVSVPSDLSGNVHIRQQHGQVLVCQIDVEDHRRHRRKPSVVWILVQQVPARNSATVAFTDPKLVSLTLDNHVLIDSSVLKD